MRRALVGEDVLKCAGCLSVVLVRAEQPITGYNRVTRVEIRRRQWTWLALRRTMETQMRALLLAVMAMVVLDGSAPDALAVVSDGGGPVASALAEAPDAIAAQPATVSTTSENTVRLRVAVTGDLLIHSPVFDRALANGGGQRYDFAPMFRYVRAYLTRADLAICHVETPMTSRPPSGYPIFNTPPALARAIASSGWDVCSTASNHTLDQGQFGVDATIAALNRAGVGHAGSYRSAAGRRRPAILTVKGLRVAFLSYAEHTNGIALPAPWSVNLARADRILAEARRARRAGAQVVIVNVHAGDEYRHAPSAFQRRLARRLLRSRTITAVIGQHAHVVQPITETSGRLVVYGEGNLISNQSAACCPAATQDGLIALLQIEWDSRRGARTVRIDYVPTWVRHPDYAVLPVGDAAGRGLANRAALRASYHRTVAVVGRSTRVQPVPLRAP
jgi:Bacterial capsule synthesis protein PGA_cap